MQRSKDPREQAWQKLAQGPFDLLIIGGGVIGAGAARDAAMRGLRVAVVEAQDIASGTSSRSSKLIHGGLRYLEQREFGLVFESVSERRTMMHIAPHLARPLGFLFPNYTHDPVQLATLWLGLTVYEALALFRSPKPYKTISAKKLRKELPGLRQDGLRGGALYFDCMTDDARLTLETMLDARQSGAVVLNYARVADLIHGPDGRLRGLRVEDRLAPPGQPRHVDCFAPVVINATGPWSDRVRSHGEFQSNQLRLTKGVHIVVPAHRVPLLHTIVAFHPRDHRVLFIIPWGDQVYIGTTDTDYEGDPAEVAADRADIDYLLEAVDAYFPGAQLRPEEITSTWAGLRPLIRPGDNVDPSKVPREHVIATDANGLISIAGGKLTTHRRMGAEVVQEAVKAMARAGHQHPELRLVDTGRTPLPGAVGWPLDGDGGRMVAEKVVQAAAGRLPEPTCLYLADRYGTRAIDLVRHALSDQRLLAPLAPGRPEILAQVDWAVMHELAVTVTDVLERRTQLYFRDLDQGLGAVEAVAGRMAELLGWSEEERLRSADGYRVEVDRSRRWKSEAPSTGGGQAAAVG